MTLATGDSIIYAVLLLIDFLIILVVGFIAFYIDGGNRRNEDGTWAGINLKKYVKIILIALIYPLFIILLNLMNAVATQLVDVTQFAGQIGFLFGLLLRATWVWTIFIVIWLGYNAWRDMEIKKIIKDLEDYR